MTFPSPVTSVVVVEPLLKDPIRENETQEERLFRRLKNVVTQFAGERVLPYVWFGLRQAVRQVKLEEGCTRTVYLSYETTDACSGVMEI